MSRRILLIDDSEPVRTAFAELLEDAGYVVEQACDGKAGISAFQRSRPDLVLTDLKMPTLDGLGVIEAIRAVDHGLPVVVLSGLGDSVEAAMQLGASASVAKPVIEMGDLLALIDELLVRPSSGAPR